MMRSRERGMTLMELMTVIVILGILTAIAVPSYRSYLRRANRVDATSALLRVAAAQEKFYLQNNTYADTDTMAKAPPDGLGIGSTEQGYYTLAIISDDLTTEFLVTATAVDDGPQATDAACNSFTIDQAGTRKAKSKADAESTAACWR
jgi:type IV pilus assembly protein PilE